MKDTKAGPIAGAAGIIALLAAALSMFGPRNTDLADKVQQYFDTADAQTPLERHRQVSEQIGTLEGFEGDAGFARLPKTRRDAVTDRLSELKAYQNYSDELAKITSAGNASSEADLKALEQQLAQLKVPVAYQTEWSDTDAGTRRRHLESDVQALRRALAETAASYRRLADESEELLKNSEAAGLPARARKIVAEAEKLPTPEDKLKPIPGASDVTYAPVFRFSAVKAEFERWEKARPDVQRLAKLGT